MEHKRHTRSFVRREGRMTTRQQQALESCADRYLIDHNNSPDLKTLFTSGKITLEIGFGMGASLAKMARLEPQMNFIGVEVHTPGVGALLASLEEHNITNVRIISADVIIVLTELIPDAFLDRVLIFFPDPWPKKRHQKRRLVQHDFIQLLKPKLKPGAVLHLATDWAHYAEHMQMIMGEFPEFARLSDQADLRLETKFERRGVRLGHQITDLVYQFSCT